MAKQILNNNETLLQHRTKVNDNFTEVYGLANDAQADADAAISGLANKVDKNGTDRLITAAEGTKLSNLSGTNTGDETVSTIRSKLGITTLSGSNTGDQDLSAYAPLASPVFTGTPTAPTPTITDNSQKLATTAFVQASKGGSTPRVTRSGGVIAFDSDGAVYNSTADPYTGNVTLDPTGAIVNSYIDLYFQGADFSAKKPSTFQLIGGNALSTGINVVRVWYRSSILQEYSIISTNAGSYDNPVSKGVFGLGTDISNTTTTPIQAGPTLNGLANTTYILRMTLYVGYGSATNGIRYGFTYPSDVSYLKWAINGTTTANTATVQQGGIIGAPASGVVAASTTFNSRSSQAQQVEVTLTVRFVTAGTLNLIFALSATGSTGTIYGESSFEWAKL